MSLALLAFAVGHELASVAAAEPDHRKRARAVRAANQAFRNARHFDACPHPPMTIEAWRDWSEPPQRLAELRQRNAELRMQVRAQAAELAELRAEIAHRDADEALRSGR